MLVVGGTYAERCNTPAWRTTQGSGMRAAIALADQGVRLLTAVDDDLAGDAELVAGASGLQRQVLARSMPVGFDYFTPLSAPRITGSRAEVADVLVGEDDSALVFGFLEAVRCEIRAREMVYDPQRPGSGTSGLRLDGLSADSLTLVLNSGEARAFGGSQDLTTAVGRLFDSTVATTVVVKAGASGCRVFARERPDAGGTPVGACPTPHVWPLGSGDTFAAGFSHALGRGADAVEAARVGSAAAAYWCSTQNPVTPDGLLAGDSSVLAELGLTYLTTEHARAGDPSSARIYLAGPFFNLGEVWLVDMVRQALLAQGVSVFSPLHDVGLGDESVAVADIEGLRDCTSVLALLDGSDFGTVFETGWAEHAGIPVVGYASRPDKEGAKMLTGLSGELHSDLSTAVYRAAWRALGAPLAVTRGSGGAEQS